MTNRKFAIQKVDYLFVENAIGSAINELRIAQTSTGKMKYNYHNLSLVVKQLDLTHSIKVNNLNVTTMTEEDKRQAVDTYNLIKKLYDKKAKQYKRINSYNHSFEPLVSKPLLLLKSVQNLMRISLT